MGEPEKIERSRVALGVFMRRHEIHQSRLVRVDFQPETAKPSGQNLLDPQGIPFIREPHDKIIGEPNQKRPSFQSGFYLVFKPFIKDGMQVDVAQHWADATTLRCSFIGIAHAPRFPDARFQELSWRNQTATPLPPERPLYLYTKIC